MNCKICGQTFQTPIHSLSQPVDIYADWVDACEEIAEETNDMNYSGGIYNETETERDLSRGSGSNAGSSAGAGAGIGSGNKNSINSPSNKKNSKSARYDEDLSDIDESDGDYVD